MSDDDYWCGAPHRSVGGPSSDLEERNGTSISQLRGQPDLPEIGNGRENDKNEDYCRASLSWRESRGKRLLASFGWGTDLEWCRAFSRTPCRVLIVKKKNEPEVRPKEAWRCRNFGAPDLESGRSRVGPSGPGDLQLISEVFDMYCLVYPD